MLKGLERRYTLEQIEAQHEDKIRPRLNYDALQTLRNPMYIKFGQQVQDASKEQHAQRLSHTQTHQTINNIANNTGVNAAELEHILNRYMGAHAQETESGKSRVLGPIKEVSRQRDFFDRGDDHDNDGNGNDRGNGGSGPSSEAADRLLERAKNAYRRSLDPENTSGATMEHWTRASMPNNEMYRINIELQAENQRLKQEAETKARQHAARLEATTPHQEELRSIVHHFHQGLGGQPPPAPPAPQDNSQLVGALQTIAQQNHAMGQVLEEKNMAARNMVELAHASMIAQMEAQRGQNAPLQPPTAAPLVSAQPPARLQVPRMVRSRSPPTAAPTPTPVPMPALPAPLPELQPPPQRAPTPQPRVLPDEPRALTRSRSNTPAPKKVALAPQAVPVQPAASSSSKGDEMRAIIAILEGPERAKSAEPAPVPQNPPMETPSAPKTAHVKKAKIIKALKAQDKKAETKEILKKGMEEFFGKKAAAPTAKARAKTVPPQQMPALSFDEMAAELEQGSFLDNPVGLRKRDTRAREAEVTAASLRPRSSASSSAQPEVRPRSGSAAVRPRELSGARILKTQRADSEGQRRITRATMLR